MASNQTPVYGLNQWSLEDGIIMAEFNADNQKTEQALVEANATIAALQQETQILRADRAALDQAFAAAKAEAKAGDNTLQAAINAAKSEAKAGDNTLQAAINAAKSEAKAGDNTLLQALNAAKATIPKIATGTYVGTGTCGPTAPCSITFDFQPKLLLVALDPPTSGSVTGNLRFQNSFSPVIAIRGSVHAITTHDNNSYGDPYAVDSVNLSWNGNTVSWWVEGTNVDVANNPDTYSQLQMNHSGLTYHYFAIG